MGKSAKIKDLSKVNGEFNSYMEELEKEMEEYAQKYEKEFQSQIGSFYANDKNTVQIEGKSYRDYQIEIEFSMKNIQEIISNTTKEIFTVSTSKESEQSEQEKIISALDNYKNMATKIAINFISNILSSLCVSQSSSYIYDIQHVSVGPGLTLHMLVVEKYYDGKGFFDKKRIIQNFIEYKLIFSRTVAAAEMDIEYIFNQIKEYKDDSATYREIKKAYTDLIVSQKFIKEKSDGELHELAGNYKSIMDDLKDSRKAAYLAVQELCTSQNALDTAVTEEEKNINIEMIDKNVLAATHAPLLKYLKGE